MNLLFGSLQAWILRIFEMDGFIIRSLICQSLSLKVAFNVQERIFMP